MRRCSARTALSGTPSAPANLKAKAVSISRINLTWKNNATDATSIEIWRKAGAGAWELLTTVGADAVSYSDTNATGNSATKTYSYYLKSCNAAGCSPVTSTAVVPYKPINLTATASAGKIDLAWTDKSAIETGFQVYRKNAACSAGGAFRLRATKGANMTTHSDTGLASGSTHAYKVRAYKKSASAPYAIGYSLFSNCDDAVAP